MKTLKDLALALLNATLILVALCLFLAWQVAQSGERIAASFADNINVLSPVSDNVSALVSEVEALRADLSTALKDQDGFTTPRLTGLQTRADQLDQDLAHIRQALNNLSETPDRMVEVAVDRTADRINASIETLIQCRAPQS